jgi:hypothetical protein
MKTIKPIITILILFFTLMIIFGGCSKDSEMENDTQNIDFQNVPLDYDLNTTLLNFQVTFWSNLSLHSLVDIQNAVNTDDINEILKMAKFSEDELQKIISDIYSNYEQDNASFIDVNDCNCLEKQNDLQNIAKFVAIIQKMGGAESFFKGINNPSVDIKSSSGPDWGKVYGCLGACSLTCMSVQWSLPLWAACMAACSTLCYTMQN